MALDSFPMSASSTLKSLPSKINQASDMDAQIKLLAEDLADKHHSLFLDRRD
ncbi:MAG: hypothetical protein MK096_07140 [Oleiphilaceae bacterium]|nr:hypothetical protein [Oleiphilaceae bacterium]